MSNKKLSAGDFVDARCTRCRVLTNHTIIAMVGEKIARVQCNTCGGTHNFHAPKEPREAAVRPAKAPSAPNKPRKDPGAAFRREWQALSLGRDTDKARPYAMDEAFREGEAVRHAAFGPGFVTAVIGLDKIEVLFEEGKKVLRCRQK